MNLPIYNKEGEKTGSEAFLEDNVFNIVPKEHSVTLDVRRILANRHLGTHKSKEKSDLSGSTRKLRKQKGSGFARVGSIKSPIFRGGARIFGPTVRDYSFKLNKKVQNLAKKSVLSQKVKEGEVLVIQDLKIDSHKTKNFRDFLSKFQIESSKVLVLASDCCKNLLLAARNLQNVNVMQAKSINSYDLLNSDKVLVEAKGIEIINDLLK